MRLGRPRVWTPAKRRRARKKANAALKRRRETIEASRGRQDSQYAGALPAIAYANQELQLRESLNSELEATMSKGRTAVYQPIDEAMALLGRLLVGISRREHVDQLLPEMVIADALEIPQWPSGDTERRFLVRASEETLQGVDDVLDVNVLEEALAHEPVTVRISGDVTGLISRARQREGVKPGYMGGPKIKPGYHMTRVIVEGIPMGVELRAGNDGCGDLPQELLEKCRKVRRKLPQGEIYAGLDSGFGKAHVIEAMQAYRRRYHDARLHFFIGGSSQYVPIWWKEVVRPAATSDRGWERVSETTEILELGWQWPWGRTRTDKVRVVATRRVEWKKSEQTKRKYRVQVIYTSRSPEALSARGVFSEYHERQRVEKDIKDSKQSFRIQELPVLELLGNRLYVRMVALAQQMMTMYVRAFEDYKGPQAWGPLSKTIRRERFEAPGKKTG